RHVEHARVSCSPVATVQDPPRPRAPSGPDEQPRRIAATTASIRSHFDAALAARWAAPLVLLLLALLSLLLRTRQLHAGFWIDAFLTYCAQETRMYELEALLSLVVAWAYVEGIVRGKRLWLPVLSVAAALLAYTHNWGLFACVGLAAATFVVVRERLRLFAVAAAGVAVLY